MRELPSRLRTFDAAEGILAGVMGGLDQHFGENASLDPATQADILKFLEANAADAGPSKMGAG